MPTEILMPALSPTMEEGKLAKWLVKEGQTIKAGDVIAEIETDKATMEVEASDEGKVGKILVAEGTEGVKVNTPIATLLAEGESESAAAAAKAPAPKAPSPQPPDQARGKLSPQRGEGARAASASPATTTGGSSAMQRAHPTGRPPTPIPSSQGGGEATAARAPRTAAAGQPAANGHGRIFASPLARRLARELGVDVGLLHGSGPRGRIIRRDVESALKDGGARLLAKAGTAVAAVPSRGVQALAQPMPDDKILALYEKGSYDIVPHDGMRKIIAQRLTLSKQTIPHFYLTVECRLDNLLHARAQVNATAPKEGPRAFKLSVNDFVIKALGLALAQVPAANVTWTEAGTLRHKFSDVGVAVAVEGGLFTPIIRHAELKSLSEISNEMKDLAARARKRRLAPHEYQGGTTSISNLGMYGITSFEAVINPPHATILAIGAGEKRPIVVGDKIEAATLMSCTLSGDHRVVDGAVGAELLNAFKMLIEEPVRMLV
jgi:pyruvate dehydrogenase E2 component (dihydrolipoyllysine-residue acetyltransferase)